MKAADIPSPIPIPFANGASTAYINTIPVESQINVTPGAASFTDGFPPLTFFPVSAGGVPPNGRDMNGILHAISASSRWMQAAGVYPWDADFAKAIGGYPLRALLSNKAGTGLWYNTVDANVTDPNAGGKGWLAINPNGNAGQRFSVAAAVKPEDAISMGQADGRYAPIGTGYRKGQIEMWHGLVADIPKVWGKGWQLADGTNGTADLRDRFVVGAGGKYAPNDTGGAESVELTVEQMPAHAHAVTDPGHGHGVGDPGHAHGVSDPGHTHGIAHGVYHNGNGDGIDTWTNAAAIGASTTPSGTGIGIQGSATGIGIQASGTNVSIQPTGGKAAHENRPPYYAVCLIEYVGG